MYSGFITPRRTLPAVGVHQRCNARAYRLIQPRIGTGAFPSWRQIRHFEGVNGPDGLKTKSPGHHDPNHLYDPVTESGELLELIRNHYSGLVAALRQGDSVRAAFEAAWLAHYVCDGLTPAHHVPLDIQVAHYTSQSEARRKDTKSKRGRARRFKHTVIVPGDTAFDSLRRSWALWGSKGLLITHFNFEIGVAAALVGHRIKTTLPEAQVGQARRVGAISYFKQEARGVAALRMYDQFCDSGWNAAMARTVRIHLAPQIVQAIATMWLLAHWEAAETVGASSDFAEATPVERPAGV